MQFYSHETAFLSFRAVRGSNTPKEAEESAAVMEIDDDKDQGVVYDMGEDTDSSEEDDEGFEEEDAGETDSDDEFEEDL